MQTATTRTGPFASPIYCVLLAAIFGSVFTAARVILDPVLGNSSPYVLYIAAVLIAGGFVLDHQVNRGLEVLHEIEAKELSELLGGLVGAIGDTASGSVVALAFLLLFALAFSGGGFGFVSSSGVVICVFVFLLIVRIIRLRFLGDVPRCVPPSGALRIERGFVRPGKERGIGVGVNGNVPPWRGGYTGDHTHPKQ
mgnify:CR=1 FL=1